MGPYNANLVTNWVAKFQNCLYDNDHDYDHMSSACMDHALSPMRRMGLLCRHRFGDTVTLNAVGADSTLTTSKT